MSMTTSMALQKLIDELDNVNQKQKVAFEQGRQSLDTLLQALDKADSDVKAGKDLAQVFKNTSTIFHMTTTDSEAAKTFHEVNSMLTKYGKLIDKQFEPHIDGAYKQDMLDPAAIDAVILDDMLRSGRFEVAKTFAKEANLTQLLESKGQLYSEISAVTSALKARNVVPAIEWLRLQRPQLTQRVASEGLRTDSLQSSFADLEFALHRLRYLQLLLPSESKEPVTSSSTREVNLPSPSKRQKLEDSAVPMDAHTTDTTSQPSQSDYNHRVRAAMQYARDSLQQFSSSKAPALRELFGCLAFAKSIDTFKLSAYRELLDDVTWKHAEMSFARVSCVLLGLPENDPLLVCVRAGAIALPKVLHFNKMLQTKADLKTLTTYDGPPPVDVELPREFQYHSTFVCPVSKEPVYGDNVPVMLVCGHVISRESMNKIVRASRLGRTRFKCPTCPQEQIPGDVKEIHF